MKFHEKLRRRVDELRLNKAKACREAGLAESTISNFLADDRSLPRVDVAMKLATALRVSVEWLCDEDIDEPAQNITTTAGATSLPHWGEWVLSRSRYLGFRRQKDLAIEVGCTEEQLSRWIQMKSPPSSMRKGFDAKLAAALQTTPEILFRRWASTPPSLAALAEPIGDEDRASLIRRIGAAAELLDLAGLIELDGAAEKLLSQQYGGGE